MIASLILGIAVKSLAACHASGECQSNYEIAFCAVMPRFCSNGDCPAKSSSHGVHTPIFYKSPTHPTQQRLGIQSRCLGDPLNMNNELSLKAHQLDNSTSTVWIGNLTLLKWEVSPPFFSDVVVQISDVKRIALKLLTSSFVLQWWSHISSFAKPVSEGLYGHEWAALALRLWSKPIPPQDHALEPPSAPERLPQRFRMLSQNLCLLQRVNLLHHPGQCPVQRVP